MLNFQGVVLDLIFISIETPSIVHAEDLLLGEDRHHPALSFVFNVLRLPAPYRGRDFLDFRKCDVDAVFHGLQKINYTFTNCLEDPVQSLNTFCNHLSYLVKIDTPMKRSGRTNFQKARSECKQLTQICHLDYISKVEDSILVTIKSF